MAEEKPGKAGAGGGGGEEGVNVQVLLRCRALSEREIADRAPQVITCNEALREVTLFQTGGKSLSRTFRFDKVFGPDSTQEKLFKQAIVPIVGEVMDGFNCTIFAYGQTGTGKTYTMEGGPRESDDGRKLSAQAGVIPRAIKQIFDTIEANNSDSTVKVSFLELYNEELTDLMSFDSADDTKKLRLLEDRSGVVVQGLEEVIVRSAAEIYQILDRGTAKRKTAATLLNNRSSRSHSIFTITIHMKETTPEGEDVIKIGKLNLVDLAGSENISRSGAKDGRAREAGSINQSLLTLGRVITALVEHSGHVPYRDSKLTRLLRDSLGGRTKTCIIATIAPTVQCQEETVSTLDYAHRAKNIRNRPELNQRISKTTMIKELAAEIERLKLDLVCTREKNGVYLSAERYEQSELERAQLRETVKAMRAEAEAEEANHTAALEAMKAQHASEVEVLTSSLERKEAELAERTDELNLAHVTIQERVFVGHAHKRAEQALAVHAQQLTGELGACVADINALFARLDEVAALQGQDRQVLTSVRGLVSSRLGDLGGSVKDALDQHAAHLAGVASDLDAFRTTSEEELTALKLQVEKVASGVQELRNATVSSLAALSDRNGSELSKVASQGEASAKEAVAAGEAAACAAQAAVSALASALRTQAKQLKAMAAAQAEAVTKAHGAVNNLAGCARSGLQDVSKAARELQSSGDAAAAQAQQMMTRFASTYEESMKAQQAQLLEQVGALLGAFATERSHALSQGMQAIASQLSTAQATARNQAQGLETAATSVLKAVEENEQACTSQLGQVAEGTRTHVVAMAAAAESAAARGDAASQEVAAAQASASTSLQQHAQATTSALRTCASSLTSTASSTAQAVTSAAESLCSSQAGVARSVEAQASRAVSFANSLRSGTADAVAALEGFQASHQQAVQQAGAEVSTSISRQLDQVSHAPLPQRRSLPVPSLAAVSDLICPAEEVLLQQLRATKKDILRRGGDVRAAATLLLSPALAGRLGLPLTSPQPAMRASAGGGPPSPAGVLNFGGFSNGVGGNSENLAPSTGPTAMLMSPGYPSSAASGVQAPPSSSSIQYVRSKIPGAPFLATPGKGPVGLGATSYPSAQQQTAARAGLADKTNA